MQQIKPTTVVRRRPAEPAPPAAPAERPPVEAPAPAPMPTPTPAPGGPIVERVQRLPIRRRPEDDEGQYAYDVGVFGENWNDEYTFSKQSTTDIKTGVPEDDDYYHLSW